VPRPERLITTREGTLTAPFGASEWLLLVATALMWGSSYLLIADALEGLRPLAVTFVRLVLGFVVLSAAPRARGAHIRAEDKPRLALLGVLWLALPLTLFPIAQRHVSSSVAGMITGSQPVMAAAIAAALLRRRPTSAAAGGLAVGLVGVLVVVIDTTSGSGSAPVLDTALVLAAVFCYALATNLAVPLQQRYGALVVISRALAVSVVLLAIPGVIALAQSSPTAGSIAAVIPLGVLSTGAGYVTFATLVGRAGATRGAVAIYLVPVVAVVLGVIFRGDHVEAIALCGAVLVTIGAVLTGRSRR
jgi:drug/metabolite transporter (DMT)-like permease